MARMRMEPVTDRSVWTGSDLARVRDWEYVLDDAHLGELDTALSKVRNVPIRDIVREDFSTSRVGALMSTLSEQLQSGRGFALLRNFPVERYDLPDLERLYWGLCLQVGPAVTQNGQGGLIHYVTDGKLQPSQGNRGVGKPQESRLHVDLTDCVSLLCVRQAPDDPPSRVASSTHIYNEMLRTRPQGLSRLYDGFEWYRHSASETALFD